MEVQEESLVTSGQGQNAITFWDWQCYPLSLLDVTGTSTLSVPFLPSLFAFLFSQSFFPYRDPLPSLMLCLNDTTCTSDNQLKIPQKWQNLYIYCSWNVMLSCGFSLVLYTYNITYSSYNEIQLSSTHIPPNEPARDNHHHRAQNLAWLYFNNITYWQTIHEASFPLRLSNHIINKIAWNLGVNQA